MLFSLGEREKAIGYYRHSAEDKQENSVLIQSKDTEKLLAEQGVELIHTEADEGVSGVDAKRPGFERLLNDWIMNPEAPKFKYVCVYDVSRWGRFQDKDEAGYWEFICRKYGKTLIYVSHGWPKGGEENDMVDGLRTSIERYAAAEFSRKLSRDVFKGCIEISGQGYSVGGLASYGLARLLLDEQRKPISRLERGQHKSISNQRVTLTPANDQTTETVKIIFESFIKKWLRPEEIAERLNIEGIPSAAGKLWDREKVIRVLSNETYTGSIVYNKTWSRLKRKQRSNPRSEWVVSRNAFEPIISLETFTTAQERLYWLMASKWKRGIYKIKKTRSLVIDHLNDQLKTEADYNPDDYWLAKRQLPFTAGIIFYRGEKRFCCFRISEESRKYENVIGISVSLESNQPVEKFFLLPTEKFSSTNFLVMAEESPDYHNYMLAESAVEAKMRELYSTFISLRWRCQCSSWGLSDTAESVQINPILPQFVTS